MSRYNRYAEVIWFGFGIWTLGAGLLVLAGQTTSLGAIAVFLVLIGIGTGLTFQPTLVALQAHCPKAHRAVVTSNRNFLRSSGGAVGLAVSSAVLANVLKSSLPASLQNIANSTFATPDLSAYSGTQRVAIIGAYADASRAVFIWCVPCAGISFVLTALIRDRGLVRKEEELESSVAHGEQETIPQTMDGKAIQYETKPRGFEEQSKKHGMKSSGGTSICSDKGSKASSI